MERLRRREGSGADVSLHSNEGDGTSGASSGCGYRCADSGTWRLT